MDSAVGTEGRRMNRWWRVAGALAMNLPLGALYAWSIFVLPLETEFGWTRTSWVFTIAVFVFGLSFIAACVLALGSLLLAKRPESPVAVGVEVVKGETSKA